MSTQKAVERAQARQRWEVMMSWEKKCNNPETRTDPPCGTYDRLRAPKPDVDGHPPPFRSEWQRMRYENGLPMSEASAAWAQLLAHPPSAPLVHVDHGHRLEGAATAASCQNAWWPCEWYWKDQMKTDEGRARAKDRYKELASVANKGIQLDPGDDKERLVLMGLLKIGGTMPSASWSPQVRAHPAKGTRTSVLDALEARVEGLYEEHEEAGTDACQQKAKLYHNPYGYDDYLPTLLGQMDRVTMQKDFRQGYENRYTISGRFQVPNQRCGTSSAQDECGGVIFRVFYVDVKTTETGVQYTFKVNSYPGGKESNPTVTADIAKKCSDASAYDFNRQNYVGKHVDQLETVLKGIAKYITQKNAVSNAAKLLNSATEGFDYLKGKLARSAKK